jgi:hypothetical protein
MLTVVRGAIGGLILFLGRELNFLIAGGFAAMIGLRVVPLLPTTWPAWGDTAFVVVLAMVAAGITISNDRVGYVVSGFLMGGYFLADYFVPGFIAIPIVPFLVGGIAGGVLMGFLTEWALMIVSSLIGAIYVMDLFTLRPTLEMIITGGLFLAGALTQVIMRRMQKHPINER